MRPLKSPFSGAFLNMSTLRPLYRPWFTAFLIDIFDNSGDSLSASYTGRYDAVFLLLSF